MLDIKQSWNVNDLSIQKACDEYNDGVRLTLMVLNQQLDDSLTKSWNGLDELSMKIEARTNFLEKNPSFLSCMIYNKRNVKCDPLREFDEIKITLEEHSKKFADKLQEIQKLHQKLFDLVMMSGHDQTVVDEFVMIKECIKEHEEPFHDCLDKLEAKKPSLDKVRIEEHAYSDVSLDGEPPKKKYQLFPDISATADVQRRTAQEDLHEKLIQQTIATDSLEGFIKLMQRQPIEKRKEVKKEQLENKYAGSLWFFPSNKTTIKKKSSKTVTEKAQTSCNLLVTSSQPSPICNQERTRKVKQSLGRQKLKYYDLLDDLDYNDLKPIKSEYPRRDNIYPMKLKEAKSYLHRMMEENEKVWKKLLQAEKKRQQKLRPAKAKHVKNLIEYLTAPQQKYLNDIPQSLIVMPVKIIYDNFPTKDKIETPRGAVLITDLTKTNVDGKYLQAKTETKLLGETRSSPFPMQRKKEMLDQLRGLKMRNDNIQKNIQKAIDVIETKMIDLLSAPADATSSEAFNVMEEEITTVLKMMSDSEQKPREREQGEKLEPEHDSARPKVKKAKMPVEVRSKSIEKKKDEKKWPRERNKEDKKQFKGKEFSDRVKVIKPPKIEERVKMVTDVKEENKVQVPTSPKIIIEETKKAADIEEGERLLGQVDSVIKKIDNIYNKFYEEGKSKSKPGEFSNFSSIVEFLDGVKEIAETHPEFVEYINYEDKLTVLEEPCVFYQAEVFHHTTLIEPPSLKELPNEVSLAKKVHFIPPPEEEFVTEFQKFETILKTATFNPQKIDENRHEYTLRAFYTLFFSSIFVALNLDYAS